MLRRPLAVFLVFSWVSLSAFDLLEDLDSPVDILVHSPGSTGDSLPNAGHGGQLANNILEWSDRIGSPAGALVELPTFDSSVDAPKVSKKSPYDP